MLPPRGDLCRVQLSEDQDSFFPASMGSSAQTIAKRTGADANRGNPSASVIAPRERGASGAGDIRPSKGAEDVYVQARTLFRAMVQMPHYSEEVSILSSL